MSSITILLKKIDAELLVTGTDSLTYKIKLEDEYADFYKDQHLFDLSNNPKDSKFFDPVNETVIGKMKDVLKGKPICEVVGIKSKMHCILSVDGKKSSTTKGVYIAIEFNEYKDILFSKK